MDGENQYTADPIAENPNSQQAANLIVVEYSSWVACQMEMTPVLVASNTVLAMWPCAMRILCDMASLLIRVLLRSAYRFQKCHFLMCLLTSSITKLMFSNRFRNLCSLISTISSMNSMITPAFFCCVTFTRQNLHFCHDQGIHRGSDCDPQDPFVQTTCRGNEESFRSFRGLLNLY